MTETATATEITSANVRFPASEGGVHTFKVGDQVVFADKYQHARTGPVKTFERIGAKAYATVEADGIPMLVALGHLLFPEHPRAVELLKPVVHLVCGTVVRVQLPAGKQYGGIKDGDLGVVLIDKGARVNVAKLGGCADKYGRFTHGILTVVTLDPRTGAQL